MPFITDPGIRVCARPGCGQEVSTCSSAPHDEHVEDGRLVYDTYAVTNHPCGHVLITAEPGDAVHKP